MLTKEEWEQYRDSLDGATLDPPEDLQPEPRKRFDQTRDDLVNRAMVFRNLAGRIEALLPPRDMDTEDAKFFGYTPPKVAWDYEWRHENDKNAQQ